MNVKEKTQELFIADENLRYLNTMTIATRIDLENFMYNHLNDITIKDNVWKNVRSLNELFLRYRSNGKPLSLVELSLAEFSSKNNRDYLLKKSRLDLEEFVMRFQKFYNYDAKQALEDYFDPVIKRPSLKTQVNMLNTMFLSSCGNYSEESFLMQEFTNESLAPPILPRANTLDDSDQIYTGPKLHKDDYDGNKMNRLFFTDYKGRYNGIPTFNYLERNYPDAGVEEGLGQGYTEYSQSLRKLGTAREINTARIRDMVGKSYK